MEEFNWIISLTLLKTDSQRHTRSLIIKPLSTKHLKFKIKTKGAKKANFRTLGGLNNEQKILGKDTGDCE